MEIYWEFMTRTPKQKISSMLLFKRYDKYLDTMFFGFSLINRCVILLVIVRLSLNNFCQEWPQAEKPTTWLDFLELEM